MHILEVKMKCKQCKQKGGINIHKKIVTLLVLLVLAVGALALTGCSSDEHDEALVGTWAYSNVPDFVLEFNADGTGRRNWAGGVFEGYSWSTSGDRLNINRDSAPSGERRNERWTYTVSGDTLTIQSQHETHRTYVYIRVN